MRTTIESYKSRAGRTDVSELDFGSFAHQPLDPEALRCLTYMHDVELNTVCYLHRAPDDVRASRPRGDLVPVLLGVGGDVARRGHRSGARGARTPGGVRAGGRPARRAPQGGCVPAGKGGVVNRAHRRGLRGHTHGLGGDQRVVRGGPYSRLMQRADHPVLSELLRMIMRQEGRHADFYASQATARLAARKRTRRLTRFTLQRYWQTVGSDIMPAAEVAFVVGYLFAGDDGRSTAERIDRRVDRLPGLQGLSLATRTVDRHVTPGRGAVARPATPSLTPQVPQAPPAPPAALEPWSHRPRSPAPIE